MEPTNTQPLLEGLTKVINDIAATIGKFQVQFALGEAEAIDAFAEQKKKVTTGLNKAENYLANLIPAAEANPSVQNEIDQASVKIEILRLHFHFREMSEEACDNKINELKSRINLMPHNLDLHDHLLSVVEEIKAAHELKDKSIPKTK